MPKTTHVVWVSGGKDSTALALRLQEIHPEIPFRYVCTPTGDELPPMVAHMAHLEELLGQPVERLKHTLDLNEMISDKHAIPNWRMRWCTRDLKINIAKAFYLRHQPSIAYVGLRADEQDRKGGIFGDLVDQRYPFQDWGWGLKEILGYLEARKVTIPKRTDCARCPFQKLSEWWDLWREYPNTYAHAEKQEKDIGHTFRSPSRDTWPASLEGLRQRFEKGDMPRGAGKACSDVNTSCRACSL